MSSLAYRRKKRRNYRRNQERRARLVAEGMTAEQAQAVIEDDGRRKMRRDVARSRAEARELRPLRDAIRARDDALYPTQPQTPESVPDIPSGGFETNRRRH